MQEPVFGLCPLCSQQKQLEKSHYVGRALHLLSQDDSGAVFMTPQRIEAIGQANLAHLLCGGVRRHSGRERKLRARVDKQKRPLPTAGTS